MKAITVRQPWASLIAAGVKTIDTRPRSTSYRGRIAIHAGLRFHEPFREAMEACMAAGLSGFSSIVLSAARAAPPLGPPRGAVVASAVLTDCVPIVAEYSDNPPEQFVLVGVGGLGRTVVRRAQRAPMPGPGIHSYDFLTQAALTDDWTDQLPYGDFSPGRWALLLDDIKPTTERCPPCWGDPVYHGLGCDLCRGAGVCDPVPARGQQAVPWEWTP